MEPRRDEFARIAQEAARATVDLMERERRYRGDLRIIRILIIVMLLGSLILPTPAAVAIAAVTTTYAFIYRRHIGLRWVLLPGFFVLFFVVGMVIQRY